MGSFWTTCALKMCFVWHLSGFKLGDIAPKSQFPSFPRSLGNNWLEFSRPSQELPLQVWAQPRFALLREI